MREDCDIGGVTYDANAVYNDLVVFRKYKVFPNVSV